MSCFFLCAVLTVSSSRQFNELSYAQVMEMANKATESTEYCTAICSELRMLDVLLVMA